VSSADRGHSERLERPVDALRKLIHGEKAGVGGLDSCGYLARVVVGGHKEGRVLEEILKTTAVNGGRSGQPL